MQYGLYKKMSDVHKEARLALFAIIVVMVSEPDESKNRKVLNLNKGTFIYIPSQIHPNTFTFMIFLLPLPKREVYPSCNNAGRKEWGS